MAYARTYGRWGSAPNKERCCATVPDGPYHTKQCMRPRGHGPGGYFCKVHDPAVVEARLAKRRAKQIDAALNGGGDAE